MKSLVQDILQCLENGYIYKGADGGYFAIDRSHPGPDRYIEGTCPICGADGARGDQMR